MSGQTILLLTSIAVLLLGLIGIVQRRARWRRHEVNLDDRLIRQIEREGWLSLDDDEPLDWDEIEDEERRFWKEERWDSAEEF